MININGNNLYKDPEESINTIKSKENMEQKDFYTSNNVYSDKLKIKFILVIFIFVEFLPPTINFTDILYLICNMR